MRSRSRQTTLALDAIAAAIAVLAGANDSSEKHHLICEARDCEQVVHGWKSTPPTAEQREELMRRLLRLHVSTARLRKGDGKPGA